MKKILTILLILLMTAAPCAAATEETTGGEGVVDPDEFMDWNKFTASEYTVGVTGNLEAMYEYEEEVSQSKLTDYTFNFDKYFLSHNLYEILKQRENGGMASFTYILDKGCESKSVSIKKLENDSYSVVKSYVISSLYEGMRITLEDYDCIIYAYENRDGYICVNLSLYDIQKEPEFSAQYDVSTGRIKISASFNSWNENYVNLALVRKDDNYDIGYIDQTKAINGSVVFDFKFIYDPEDYIVVLNCGSKRYEYGIVEKVDSGMVAEAYITVTENDDESITSALDANEVFYSVNKSSFLIVAFYDTSGNLMSCNVSKCWQDSINIKIPKGAVKAKAFTFESLDSVMPLTPSAEKILS